jgi:selenocysteine lyase/cysteine desulfurase
VVGSPAVDYDQPEALAAFLRRHPEFEATRRVDELRHTEYARLDLRGEVYLDYTGGGLYGESQVLRHMELLQSSVLGNPHSLNPTSRRATALAEQARSAVLRFFNASPDEYTVIFTPNATGAIKLVGEAYPFGPEGRLLLTSDNHNSVNGMREFARGAGATTTYVPSTTPSLRIEDRSIEFCIRQGRRGVPNLLAYPAQSNFSGVQHPLTWIEHAHEAGWDVLVDCAAYVPTNPLDLRRSKPDFVPISLYKLLGYPTGVGCLIARRDALAKLRRPWFAGGTIVAASVQGDWHHSAENEAGFEDGTVNYLALPAVEHGLDYLSEIGIDTVRARVRCLTEWLLEQLGRLRHANGRPAVEVYGPRSIEGRGATIAFNVLRPNGSRLHVNIVERLAAESRISLRTGCFCNPGAAEQALGISRDALVRAKGMNGTADDFAEAVGLESGGAIRVSLGVATTFRDAYRLVEFLARLRR